MLKLLSLAFVSSYSFINTGSNNLLNPKTDLLNVAQNSLSLIANQDSNVKGNLFENSVITQDVNATDIQSVTTGILQPNFQSHLMNPTGTSFNNNSYFDYGINPPTNDLIQSISTTHANGFEEVNLVIDGFDRPSFSEPQNSEIQEKASDPENEILTNLLASKVTAEDESPCTLTTFVAPEHGFIKMECPTSLDHELGIYRIVGLYPKGEEFDIASSYILGNALGIDRFRLGGEIMQDDEYYEKCEEELPCAKAEFKISREKMIEAHNYVYEISDACVENDLSKCSYSLLGGSSGLNCVDFVEKTAKVAGIQENIFEKLKVIKNSETKPLQHKIFSLADKAWKYIRAKTWGKVNLRAD